MCIAIIMKVVFLFSYNINGGCTNLKCHKSKYANLKCYDIISVTSVSCYNVCGSITHSIIW